MEHSNIEKRKQAILATQTSLSSARKQFKLVPVLVAIFLVTFLALIAFGALPRIFQQQALFLHTKAQLTEAPSVSVTIAQAGPATEEFILPGSTEAIQDAPIYARVNGYLHKRYVNIGDHVRAGQVLADIDTPEIDQQVEAAQSAVEQANASLDNAGEALKKAKADALNAADNVHKGETDLQFYTAQVKRYVELSKQGAVSLEDRDSHVQQYNSGVAILDSLNDSVRSAKATENSAKAAVRVAQAALDAARAQYHQIEATRSFKKVTALFDGIVTQRNVDAGALITSGSNNSNTILFEIAKTDILRVFVYVPEQYVPYIHTKQQTLLNFQEYPLRDFTGVVTNISGGLDPNSKTLQVEIHVPNPSHVLMPGMYAKVRFRAPMEIRLPVVPATTLQTRADGNFIYTVDSEKRAHMHKLEIARDMGGQLEVFKGIAIGDTVIVNPPDDIQDGMLINPVPAPKSEK